MTSLTPIRMLSATSVIALLVGCSSASSIAPKPANVSSDARAGASFDACPASGTIEYVSDVHNDFIYIFDGKFAGQAPCGELTKRLFHPYGLFVQPGTHDLYVANYGGSNVAVFHRGQTSPYNVYKDPTGQHTGDVVVAKDGAVIASNVFSKGQEDGSLSTWIGGPNGGTFVGNFPFVPSSHSATGAFVTIDNHDIVYFDEFHCTSQCGELWFVSCPAGACGTQTQSSGVAFSAPGGLAVDDTGDVLLTDVGASNAKTFELPNPNPSIFPLLGAPFGMAINKQSSHWFVADTQNKDAAEYAYPSGSLIGTVACPGNCIPFGVAVDP
jgi:DNA-binding beta-propeller fold protein YncE